MVGGCGHAHRHKTQTQQLVVGAGLPVLPAVHATKHKHACPSSCVSLSLLEPMSRSFLGKRFSPQCLHTKQHKGHRRGNIQQSLSQEAVIGAWSLKNTTDLRLRSPWMQKLSRNDLLYIVIHKAGSPQQSLNFYDLQHSKQTCALAAASQHHAQLQLGAYQPSKYSNGCQSSAASNHTHTQQLFNWHLPAVS